LYDISNGETRVSSALQTLDQVVRTMTVATLIRRPESGQLLQLPDPSGHPVNVSDPRLTSLFEEVLDRLAALPLSVEEFSFASNWTISARWLNQAGEAGAARYQLRIVIEKFFSPDGRPRRELPEACP
jgi:hypothetical protein